MKINRENNIKVFNQDVKKNAGYIYTDDKFFSAKIATSKQTEQLVKLIKKYFPEKIKILDIGCGDGKHTVELYKLTHPHLIMGIDPAKEAISVARRKIENKYKNKIEFRVGNIYDIDKLFYKGQFDLVVIRGVLHHLYDPVNAIKRISGIFSSVIIIEANGYNPILKIIEKVSLYHLEHEEKSYWPPLLNQWFREQGYQAISEHYAGIVPYFCPDYMAKSLKFIEPLFENIPLLNRLYCACNYILYQKYE